MTALAYTLGAFGVILLLARVKVPLSAAIMVGTVSLAAAFGLGPGGIVRAFVGGAVRPMTIAVVVITILLLALSEMMRTAGQLDEIVSLAGSAFRRPAVAMATMPALIGLLPMPGGALFSAPMVKSAAGGSEVSGGRLSAVNYWFRHIWEHWWPLYPGVILAMTLTRSSPWAFVAWQLPLGVFMASAGLLIFRGSHPDLRVAGPRADRGTGRRLLRATSSIWVILIAWAAVTAALWAALGGPPSQPPGAAALSAHQQAVATAHRFVPVTAGLLVSLLWTARLHRLEAGKVRAILTTRSIYSLVGLVVSVMVFQHVLKEVGAAPRIGAGLKALHVPVVVVVMALPFVGGMVTGLAIGFVGTSFPIVLALVAALPGAPAMRPYAVLAYGCGHLGMMLSPLHLCHVLSNRYFNTTFGAVYRRILAPAALLGALEGAYFVALRLLLGG